MTLAINIGQQSYSLEVNDSELFVNQAYTVQLNDTVSFALSYKDKQNLAKSEWDAAQQFKVSGVSAQPHTVQLVTQNDQKQVADIVFSVAEGSAEDPADRDANRQESQGISPQKDGDNEPDALKQSPDKKS